jgi:RNA polymerase sigma factor (sigma-70 family)
MGSCHESEPATVENFGLVVTTVRPLTPEGEIDSSLYLLKEEEIAGKDQEKEQDIVGTREQILSLYRESRPRLFGYIRSLHLKHDQIEEVIQETFLRLATELVRGTDIENVQGWLMRVAHNLAVDVLKRRERDATQITDLSSVEVETFVDPKAGPYETYQMEEKVRRMETALSVLNPQQRECFNMRVQGFRYKDIGHVLGISEQRAAIVLKQVAVRLAAVCSEEERK